MKLFLFLQHLIKIERRNRNNDAMLSTYSHIDVYHDWDTGTMGMTLGLIYSMMCIYVIHAYRK